MKDLTFTIVRDLEYPHVNVFLTPKEYQNYLGSYTNTSVTAKPTDTGYLVSTDKHENKSGNLIHWLTYKFPKETKQAMALAKYCLGCRLLDESKEVLQGLTEVSSVSSVVEGLSDKAINSNLFYQTSFSIEFIKQIKNFRKDITDENLIELYETAIEIHGKPITDIETAIYLNTFNGCISIERNGKDIAILCREDGKYIWIKLEK